MYILIGSYYVFTWCHMCTLIWDVCMGPYVFMGSYVFICIDMGSYLYLHYYIYYSYITIFVTDNIIYVAAHLTAVQPRHIFVIFLFPVYK